MKEYIIVRKNTNSVDKKQVPIKDAYEYIQKTMECIKGYKEYLKKHGHHFTNELATHASKMMINANGVTHCWEPNQIKTELIQYGFNVPDSLIGDATYLANMYYADLYPDPLSNEMLCILAAYKIINDPDGYEGMVFRRWVSDIVGKKVEIDWEHFT